MTTQLSYKIVISGKIAELFAIHKPKKRAFIPREKKYKRYFVNNSDIRLDNILRTKSRFKRLVRSNPNLTKFITLTFAENQTDLTYANKYFNKFIKRLTALYPSFQYIAVPEFQKRGAVHYHLLCNISTFVENKTLADVWGAGFVNIQNLRKIGIKRIDLYMIKYLTKGIDNRLFGRRRFLCSRGIKKPIILTAVKQFVILKMFNNLKLIYKKRFDFTWGLSLNYYQYSFEHL